MDSGETAKRSGDGEPLVAVWPGMGHVALTAGFYLMSKLHMHEEEPPETGDLFDLDHVDVAGGLAKAGHVPASHLFVPGSAERSRDFALMIGEAQPPLHKLDYCRRILDRAGKLGIAQVFTFAAMATDIQPKDPSRVLGVATDAAGMDSLRRRKIEILEEGRIMGMNGVFLAAAAERGISGVCLLGVMPAFAMRVPYPKASHAVLDAFVRLTGIGVDLSELAEYGRLIEEQLTEGLEKIQEALEGREGDETPEPSAETDEPAGPDPVVEEPAQGPSPGDRQRIEELFRQATRDRSKAFELKKELDHLKAFKEYENRFLDLFRKRK